MALIGIVSSQNKLCCVTANINIIITINDPRSYAAHPVSVRVDVPRHIEVDHVPDVRDVEAARRHVGGHQHRELLLLEGSDDVVTLCLEHVPLQAPGTASRGVSEISW